MGDHHDRCLLSTQAANPSGALTLTSNEMTGSGACRPHLAFLVMRAGITRAEGFT
jgi:hypothetical protein